MKKIVLLFLTIIFTGFVFAPTLGVSYLSSSFSSVEDSLAEVEVKIKSVASLLILSKEVAKKIVLEATAYGPPLFPEKSLTKIGQPVGWGAVAVDPRFIPLGSAVYFPENFPGTEFRAIDTGRKIKGAKIDIWLPTKKAVKQWGRRKVVAFVLNAKPSL